MTVNQWQTIKKAAQTTGIYEHRIREWCKQGTVPGFYSGTRFYINMPAFIEQLNTGVYSKAGEKGTA